MAEPRAEGDRHARALVTGGAGFIGSHLVDDLLAAGAKVRVLDNLSSGSLENLALAVAAGDVEIIEGDILDADLVSKAAAGADAISHQAAQLEIVRCLEDPAHDLTVNAVGTVNVFEAARHNGIGTVVYASSACVYGQARSVPQREDHPTEPNWPYGISKLATEHYARLYAANHGTGMVGLRYGIVYGPREWYGRVLTAWLRRAVDGGAPVVWGGHQQRDFVHVSDIVDLHRRCLEQTDAGSGAIALNAATGRGTSIRELAETMVGQFDLPPVIYEDVAEGEVSELVTGRVRLPAELEQMVLASDLAAERYGWEAEVGLADGLASEMEWLQANLHRWDAMRY